MPIYEYRCNHCGHELEAIQKISESPLSTCPACATDGLKKKISATVFRLKGKGWYETDFKSDKKRNVAGDDDGAAKDSAARDAAKEKENGKDKAQQQGKPDSGSEKSGKGETSNSKAGDKSASESKTSRSGAGSTG